MKTGCCLTILLAWILWEEHFGFRVNKIIYHGYYVNSSFTTLVACEDNIKGMTKLLSTQGLAVKGPNRVEKYTDNYTRVQVDLICLPDTIDPRETRR